MRLGLCADRTTFHFSTCSFHLARRPSLRVQRLQTAGAAVQMTKAEWAKLHRDFKSTLNNQKACLKLVEGKGTCLVPVIITDRTRTRADAASALSKMKRFMGHSQRTALGEMSYSHDRAERQALYQKLEEQAEIIEKMPETYQTDGQGDEAIASLHYFRGGMDWYIIERDMMPEQLQAFGLANLGHGGELGYINIEEITKYGAELDLHWTPKTIEQIKKG